MEEAGEAQREKVTSIHQEIFNLPILFSIQANADATPLLIFFFLILMEQSAGVLPERTDFRRDLKQSRGGGGGTGEACLLALCHVKMIPGFLMT